MNDVDEYSYKTNFNLNEKKKELSRRRVVELKSSGAHNFVGNERSEFQLYA